MVLEKTPESPLDCKEIQPVHPIGDQPWVFIGRTDAEAETPILGPPHAKSWPTRKDPDAGRDWAQEEKGITEDEMDGQTHVHRIGITDLMDMSLNEFRELVMGRKAWRIVIQGAQRVGHDWATELNWTGTENVGRELNKKTNDFSQGICSLSEETKFKQVKVNITVLDLIYTILVIWVLIIEKINTIKRRNMAISI